MKSNPDLKKAVSVAALGDGASLRKFLRSDPDLAADPRLLSEAALHGQDAIARLLIDAGADLDEPVPSHERYRPLHRAIEHRGVPKNAGHRKVVEMLLEAGASLETRATWMQLIPLAVAGMAGDAEMIVLLREAGSPVDIFSSAILGDVAGVRRFCRRDGAARSKDENRMTVLHYAALSGLGGAGENFREIANLLLDAGADGDAREDIGPYPATPVLHFAAWKNQVVAEVLLGRGCNPNFGFGNCLWREPGAMAKLFLAHGADVNGREPGGQPLLNSRINWNLPSVALWLLKNGADPNLVDQEGNTALHEAASRGINVAVVAAIFQAGVDRNTRNRAGRTALDIAQARKREKIVRILE